MCNDALFTLDLNLILNQVSKLLSGNSENPKTTSVYIVHKNVKLQFKYFRFFIV